MSAGFPLDPDRVGELTECIDTMQRVQKLIEGQIENLTRLQQKDIQAIFTNANPLENRQSPWHGFTHRRIVTRLEWFRDSLLPILDQDRTKLVDFQKQFSEFWDIETRARVSDTGKLHIANMHKIWRAIETSLENTASEGPYRVEAMTECKFHLDRRRSELSRMNYRTGKAWCEPRWAHILVKEWVEVTSLAWSLELSTQPVGQRQDSNLNGDIPRPSSDSVDWDPEGVRPKDKRKDGRGHHALLKKEICLVTACLVAALVYSILRHDVQTGFTVAGVMFALGNVLLAAIECKWGSRTRKIKLYN